MASTTFGGVLTIIVGSYLTLRGLVSYVTWARAYCHVGSYQKARASPYDLHAAVCSRLISGDTILLNRDNLHADRGTLQLSKGTLQLAKGTPPSCLEVLSTMLETIAVGVMLVRVVGTMPRREAKNFSRFRDFSSAVWQESCIFAR